MFARAGTIRGSRARTASATRISTPATAIACHRTRDERTRRTGLTAGTAALAKVYLRVNCGSNLCRQAQHHVPAITDRAASVALPSAHGGYKMVRILRMIRLATLVAAATLFYMQPTSAHSRFTWVESDFLCASEADDAYCASSCVDWDYPGIECWSGYCDMDDLDCHCDCQPSN
jgi:hypothetical protein